MFESIAVPRAGGHGVSKHPHRREEGWTAVAASSAQKPLAEGNCWSDDPFLLTSCVKYNLQHLPPAAMSFPISLLLEYVWSVLKLTYSFYIIALGKRVVKTSPCHFQATLFVWHWDLLLLAACCLHKWLLEQEARQLWICASLCLPPLGSRLPVWCTCIIPADFVLTQSPTRAVIFWGRHFEGS